MASEGPKDPGRQGHTPDTALGETFKEIENAETDVLDEPEDDDSDGEAGDALTPNEGAQESIHDDE
ncbi:hypothetical protein GCM10010277_07040 [Streptomyces longisporoflavus]|uniref:hypothetical protein n=1 Tax=Streptomyces longisporoflavus TaxID=28044 RepID=UPI00167D265C|nr:hypothetical protein [Streptomyces longisporoflavus]GGV25840.1 hypothetical protein GCM10010277_07040 [Streptomyces longisporoflavus]